MRAETYIHGFKIKRVRELPELEGRLWEMTHEKTGAELCWLDRADENKAFSIAFKTLPEDSTGVFHILEHSVLCGSDKYPVKEPFVELLKTSLQTFLNAMTYPDKTVYPVSSRNDQDFLNLMDIYLDAVFHPAIYRLPEIFRQEGWRYEGEGEDLCYQGVVLNEMKGALADPGTVLEAEMNRLLFPDNCYCHVSGGDPEHIPDLSYEQFIASHRKYYHPSNARISLVGSVDLDAALKRAILDAGLGQDMAVSVHDGIRQTWLSWDVWNTDASKLPAIRQTIRETLEKLAADGLDRKRLEACYNQFAFRLRDRDSSGFPRSLGEALDMLEGWLYGGDPADGLLVEDQLNALAARLDTDYFVDLIRELLLDDSHSVTVVRHRPIRWERRRRNLCPWR